MTMRKILLAGWIVTCGLLAFLTAENRAMSDTPKAAVPADTDVTDFKDWRFACTQADKKSPKECRIFERVSWGKDKSHQLSMSVLVFAVDEKSAAASKAKEKPAALLRVIMPLGVDLRAGVAMVIGKGGKQANIPYSMCVPAGCIANIGLVSGIIDKIKAADRVTIAYKSPGPGKGVGLKVSTKGFPQAYDALVKASKG